MLTVSSDEIVHWEIYFFLYFYLTINTAFRIHVSIEKKLVVLTVLSQTQKIDSDIEHSEKYQNYQKGHVEVKSKPPISTCSLKPRHLVTGSQG